MDINKRKALIWALSLDSGEYPDDYNELPEVDLRQSDLENYRELQLCFKEVDQQMSLISDATQEKVLHQIDYVMDSIEQSEIERNSLKEKIFKNWSKFFETFFLSIYFMFYSDQSEPDTNQSLRRHSGLIATVMILVIILTTAILINNNQSNKTTGQRTQISIMRKISSDKPEIVEVSKGVQAALNTESAFTQYTDTHIRLDRGNIWLDVEKSGEGFEVDAADLKIKVVGTSFGVNRQSPEETLVKVVEGIVIVLLKDKIFTLKENQTLSLDSQTGQVEIEETISQKPSWVVLLESLRSAKKYDAHLVAYWDFDEFTKNEAHYFVKDKGPWGFDAKAVNMDQIELDVHSNQPELFGEAIRLDHNKSQWLSPASPDLLGKKISGNFTLMCWARSERPDADWQRIFGSVGTNSWRFGIMEGNINLHSVLDWENEIGMGVKMDSESIYNQWVHLAFTVDRNEKLVKFYFNGKHLKDFSIEGIFPDSSKSWRIGSGYSRNNKTDINTTWGGYLDELRLYGRVLTESEIREISAVDFIKNLKQSR